jgi:HD superfamily phosphodiesterase
MFTYKDILNNEFVINEYKKIDDINPYPFNHGLKHVKNVCSVMEKITDILNIEGEEKEALLIAAALHDIGQADGRDNHGLKARKIVEKEFINELKENKYCDDILNAIENHDQSFNVDYPLFTILVQFADKMDFTKNRLEDDWKEKFDKEYYWAERNDIEFIYNEEYFGINILANKVENEMQRFYDENFSQKVIAAVKTLAKKLELKPVIKINGNEILLNNYLIIHGSFGSPEGNWFPYLRQELVNRKQNVKVPQMPVGVGVQNYESWSKVLNKKCLID